MGLPEGQEKEEEGGKEAEEEEGKRRRKERKRKRRGRRGAGDMSPGSVSWTVFSSAHGGHGGTSFGTFSDLAWWIWSNTLTGLSVFAIRFRGPCPRPFQSWN